MSCACFFEALKSLQSKESELGFGGKTVPSGQVNPGTKVTEQLEAL